MVGRLVFKMLIRLEQIKVLNIMETKHGVVDEKKGAGMSLGI